jgi:hypothetical protein
MPSNNTRKAALERACTQCGTIFWPYHDRSHYCSRACMSAGFSNRVERICEQCGATFATKPSQVAQGKGRMCSKACANAALLTDPVARFWSYVNKTEMCWLWTGATDQDGYGLFWEGTRQIRAHVYSRGLHNGPIPAGHGVLHKCDTPPCVRPDHLFTGTHLDNMADKVAKGRQAIGEQQGNAKLTDALVIALLADRAAGMTLKVLGAKYGVHFGTVHRICEGKTWRHIARPHSLNLLPPSDFDGSET